MHLGSPDETGRKYAYANAVIEPWDGPAAICAVHGEWAIAGMDRNGLRPLRYTQTDEYLIVGSETGMVEVDESKIKEKGRVGPGQMIAVNFNQEKLYKDNDLKSYLSSSKPFSNWKGICRVALVIDSEL